MRYLKGMPIKEISEALDYFVYMTYNLLGQWDHGNEWCVVYNDGAGVVDAC
jgi:GH18 family chitinase